MSPGAIARGVLLSLATLASAACADAPPPQVAPPIESRPPARTTQRAARPLGEPVAMPEAPSLAAPGDRESDVVAQTRLASGVRLVTIVRRGAPLTHFFLGIDRGAVDAPPGVAEVAAFAIALGDPYGIDGMYAHEHLDLLGASLSATTFEDSVVARVASLPELLPSALARVLPVMAAPDFNEGNVKLARVHVASAHAGVADVRSRTGHKLFEMLFPPPQTRGTPAGRFGASEATLRAVDPAHVRSFGEAFVTAEHAFVVVAGDFDPAQMKPSVERALGRLPAKSRVAPPPVPLPSTTSSCEHRVVLVPQSGLAQVTIAIGVMVPSPASETSAEVDVLSEAAAGGLDSRLTRRLRAELGASYHVDGHVFPSRFNGVLAFVASVDPKRAVDALRGANEELDRLAREPMDERELTVAKLRALHDDDGSVGGVALRLARDIGSGLSVEAIDARRRRIRAVTAEDVRVVADRHAASARRCVIVSGDVEALTGSIAALGLGPVEVDKKR